MKTCKKCDQDKDVCDFYARDNTCKECRKAMVRANRKSKIDYYRKYDAARANRPDRVLARAAYQKTEAGKNAATRAKKRWIEINPVKRAANVILGNAIRDGKIQKPGLCSECGYTGRIHGHHDDYAFPLSVRWLCAQCHSDWHKENGEGLNC